MNEIINKQIEEGLIDISFNEHLRVHGATDIININRNTMHIHFDDDVDELKTWLSKVANGEIIFIENMCWFSPKRLTGILLLPWNLRMIDRAKFEKNKEKFLSKKYLRIYTGNEIIKK